MDSELRLQRRRVRLFFAGLLVISGMLDIVGALLVQHQTRSEVLETLLPATITLGGRTGAVLSGLGLLLLATGIARGKRVAFRLTLVLLMATIAFELVKDLDFEAAALFASLARSPTAYRALTERASWFLSTLPIVSYALILVALTQLLRPVLAPSPTKAERERVHQLLNVWGRNYISHLAVHGASSYHW